MADIIGDEFDNVLIGTPGGTGDTFVGGKGNDEMRPEPGGSSTVDYGRETGTQGIWVNQHISEEVTLSDDRILGPDSAYDTFGDKDSITGIRHVIGSQFDDEVHGGRHDNRFFGGGGDDWFDGRGDWDTAIFRGAANEYTVAVAADGTITVTDLIAGRDGTDTLINVERLEFQGGSLSLSEVPAILAIETPNQPMKVGDVVTAQIFVTPYSGTLTLAAGSTIGGYGLTNLVKREDGRYTAQFVVSEGADVPAAGPIATNVTLILDASPVTTLPYNVPISKDSDAIDATVPTVTSISVNQNVITLVFSEPLGLDHPGETGFSVLRNGQPYGTVGIEFDPDGRTVYLNMDRSVVTGDAVTISYLGASLGFGGPFQDVGGNPVALFAGRPVVNDTPPSFWISDVAPAASEGNSGTSAYTFTVTRSGDAAAMASVQYAVAGSATEVALGYAVVAADAADFGGTLPAGTLSFASGETSKNITVLVTGDTDIEPTEYFTLTLSNPSAGTALQPPLGHIVGAFITNDDGANPPVNPPVDPPVNPGPFVPPIVDDPSPDDDFNEAQASASVASFFAGVAPTPEKQAELNAFATLQYEAYKAAGVANPALGPFEALGRGFAETPEFATKYGAQTEAAFIAAAYVEVFGRAPTAEQEAHFQAQIDYFELIYENDGISSEQADLFAKGAALGQMIGHSTLESSAPSVQMVGVSTVGSAEVI